MALPLSALRSPPPSAPLHSSQLAPLASTLLISAPLSYAPLRSPCLSFLAVGAHAMAVVRLACGSLVACAPASNNGLLV
eukprot:scaffold9119_cov32-Tisochrysis_lutea.AAC.4